MSQERLSMKKLKEVLRLHFECKLSNRTIGRALGLSPTTVGNYTRATQLARLNWQQLSRLTNQEIVCEIAPYCTQLTAKPANKLSIDFAYVHSQLKRKGVTRELLHEEYRSSRRPNEKTISYTEFCRQYRAYKKQLKPSMRQIHVAGEKTFVDYAGPTIPIIDKNTGEIQRAMIFVGVLGASNYTFAEATLTRSLQDWIGSHVRMFEYFGGVTKLIIPDNEKSAVTKACRYDPDINPNYAAMAAHYETAIVPTRPYHPKDKAKVEVAVQVVERWILARLRHQQFFSLVELNTSIIQLLKQLNDRPFKKLSGSRQTLYESLDKPELKQLLCQRYEYAVIKKAQVRLDYHVEINQHYYNVPHRYIGQCVEYQMTERSVAIFHSGQRVAYHVRSDIKGQATTLPAHMPDTHTRHQCWTPQVFIAWAEVIGKHMLSLAQYAVKHKSNPECCYRIHLGFMNLAKRFTAVRLEQACEYACQHQLMSYKHIKSILTTQCDKAPDMCSASDTQETLPDKACLHNNLRGPDYYFKN